MLSRRGKLTYAAGIVRRLARGDAVTPEIAGPPRSRSRIKPGTVGERPQSRQRVQAIPSSTYRFQFNENFRFADAEALVDYLRQLGISHCYASPIFAARKESTH